MSTAGGTVTNHPLVVLLVHGVGRADIPAMEQFEQRIMAATKRRLPRDQQHLADRLLFCTPNWGAQFDDQRSEWLRGLFPESAPGAQRRQKWPRIRNILRLAGWTIGVMLLVTILHSLIFGVHLGVGWELPIAVAVALLLLAGALWIVPWHIPGWVIRMVGVLLVIALVYGFLLAMQLGFAWEILAVVAAAILIFCDALWFFPWGDVYGLGRTFEVYNVADVVFYGSDQPRELIWEKVEASLSSCLNQRYKIKKDDDERYLPVIFIGHSLGSVIVYDLLLGIAARIKDPQKPAVRRELTRMKQSATIVPDEERARFMRRMDLFKRIANLQDVVRPLGMITMGSPISLFLFRKPALTGRRDLWREALPGIFGPEGIFTTPIEHEVRWRWQNFWHPADFVAHRIGVFFNKEYSRDAFVVDTRISPPVRSAIHAHGCYQTHPRVMSQIAEQLAQVLTALP